MARLARGEYLDPHSVQIVHTVQRCVRRAFLCGHDRVSKRNLDHRRQWIRDRLEHLASVFGIDCLTFAVMSNHLHLVLRSRPDVVRQWSDQEVARRWLRLFPVRKSDNGQSVEPDELGLNQIVNDPRRIGELRVRLSDVSWWMRCLSETIARRANREDGCTGRFWQGRYRAQLILDEASLLACTLYVDLNPVRAALAETPEKSRYTGARERIDDLRQSSRERKRTKTRFRRTHRWERAGRGRRCCGWLSPLEIDEKRDPPGPDADNSGRRASCKGFLSLSLMKYLELLDWTGRQLRIGKRGSIPGHMTPILKRLGIEPQQWCRLVGDFGRLFKRVAGTAESVHKEATRRNQFWMHCPGSALISAG